MIGVSQLMSRVIQTTIQPAKIVAPDGEFTFQFNPATLKLTVNNNRSSDKALGQASSPPRGEIPIAATTEGSSTLSFDVVIDESEWRPGPGPLDMALYVIQSLNPLFDIPGTITTKNVLESKSLGMMSLLAPQIAGTVKQWFIWSRAEERGGVVGGKASGNDLPEILFIWGDMKFRGHIQTLTADMSIYDAKGNPRRAKLSVTMGGTIDGWTPE
jgi:hypothetical protein